MRVFRDFDQSSKEWLNWRNNGIGSSDIALLMSSTPVFDRTVFKVWEQRCGYERAVELDNEHIRRGKELEPIIRDKVNEYLGMDFQPVCVERTDYPYLRASLDGYVAPNKYEDFHAILEIKAPSNNVFKDYLNSWSIPTNYYYQIQYQMLCSGAKIAYFAFYNKDILNTEKEQLHENPYIIPVVADNALQLEIEKRCHMFWYAVKNKIPIGWKDNTLQLFPSKTKQFVFIVSENQLKKLKKLKFLLPVHLYEVPEYIFDENNIIFLLNYDDFLLPEIFQNCVDYNSDVYLKSFAPNSFSNLRSEIKVTKKAITDFIIEKLS